jgi:adenylate cyclase
MSVTRKLAAILVADVVGYSRLAGTDEDRTLAPQGAPQRPH